MQSVVNFTVRTAIRKYGVHNLYRDLLKLNKQNVKDKCMRYNIQSTLKEGFRSNWDVEVLLKNPNVHYLVQRSNLETHKKLSKLYLYVKDFYLI